MGAKTSTPTKILAFGDSLTAGYYDRGIRFHPYAIQLRALLKTALGRAVVVDERGLSGERTEHMVGRLRRVLEEAPAPYTHAVLLGGTNNLLSSTPDAIVADLRGMCEQLRQQGIEVFLVTVPELTPEETMVKAKETRLKVNQDIAAYVASNGAHVHLIDLAKLMPLTSATSEEERKFWDMDGVHMRPEGSDRFGDIVFEHLKPFLTSK